MQSPTPVVFTNLTYNALWQATGHKMCLITNASFIQAAAVATTQGLGGTPGTINCGTPQGVEGAACAYGSPDAAYTYRCRQATWTMSDGTSTSQLLCVPPLDPAVNTGLGKCVTLTQAQAQECSTNPFRCIGMAPLLYGLYAGVGGPINPVYAAVAKQISNPPFYDLFKSACPTCYSYSYDDPSSSFNAFDPGNTAGRYVPQPLSPLTAVTVRFGVAAGGLAFGAQAGGASARVVDKGARGEARPKNRTAALKVEAFEDALSRVSRRLAALSRESASALRTERLEAARAASNPELDLSAAN